MQLEVPSIGAVEFLELKYESHLYILQWKYQLNINGIAILRLWEKRGR